LGDNKFFKHEQIFFNELNRTELNQI